MSSIFTKIISGEIPCHKIYEDDNFFSFLDINPISEGHTLVIPKKEIDYMFDLNEELLSSILIVAKPIAAAIKETVNCKRIGMMVAGLEVPHAHLHLVPITSVSQLNFENARPANPDDLQVLSSRIRTKLIANNK